MGAKVEDNDWKVRQGWAVWLSVKLFVPLNVEKRLVGAIAWNTDKERGQRGSKCIDKAMDGPKQAKMDCQVVRNREA